MQATMMRHDNRGLKRGIAAVSIGGGEAVAIAVEVALSKTATYQNSWVLRHLPVRSSGCSGLDP